MCPDPRIQSRLSLQCLFSLPCCLSSLSNLGGLVLSKPPCLLLSAPTIHLSSLKRTAEPTTACPLPHLLIAYSGPFSLIRGPFLYAYWRIPPRSGHVPSPPPLKTLPDPTVSPFSTCLHFLSVSLYRKLVTFTDCFQVLPHFHSPSKLIISHTFRSDSTLHCTGSARPVTIGVHAADVKVNSLRHLLPAPNTWAVDCSRSPDFVPGFLLL